MKKAPSFIMKPKIIRHYFVDKASLRCDKCHAKFGVILDKKEGVGHRDCKGILRLTKGYWNENKGYQLVVIKEK